MSVDSLQPPTRQHRIVAVTPAGRRRYLELLKHYVLADDTIDAWVLWDNCRDPADRAYIEDLARAHPKIRIERLDGVDGTNRSINRFYPLAAAPDVFYLKMDDDLTWLAPRLGERLYRRALEERERYSWWSPLVVNNAVCAWLLKHHGAVEIDAELSAQAACATGWASPQFAAALHRAFLDALAAGDLDAFGARDFEVSLSRFSINCIGFFGEDVGRLGDVFCPPEVDDEEWISAVLPSLTGRPGRVIGGLTVAHFAFWTQEAALMADDVLDAYYAAAGLAPPARAQPRPVGELERRIKAVRKGLRAAWASLTGPAPQPPRFEVRRRAPASAVRTA